MTPAEIIGHLDAYSRDCITASFTYLVGPLYPYVRLGLPGIGHTNYTLVRLTDINTLTADVLDEWLTALLVGFRGCKALL